MLAALSTGESVNFCQGKRLYIHKKKNYLLSQPSDPQISPYLKNVMCNVFRF